MKLLLAHLRRNPHQYTDEQFFANRYTERETAKIAANLQYRPSDLLKEDAADAILNYCEKHLSED
jgi:hypothetical protein